MITLRAKKYPDHEIEVKEKYNQDTDQSQPKLSNWLIGQGLSLSSASIDQTGKE